MAASIDATGFTADRNVERFLTTEHLLEDAKLGAVQRQRNDRKFVLAALFLDLQGIGQLIAHPLGLQRGGADQHRVGGRFVYGLLNGGPQ